MEQAAGPVNWRGVNHPKPRGLNRLWSLQAVARGADAVCYFQWRQSRQGAEKFHSGMVSHAGEHGRTFREVKQLGAELATIGGGGERAARAGRGRDPARLGLLVGGRPGGQAVQAPSTTRRSCEPGTGPCGRPASPPSSPTPRHDLIRVPDGGRAAAVSADGRGDRQPGRLRTGRRHTRLRLLHRDRRRGRPGAAGRHGRAAARAVRHPNAARVVAARRGRARWSATASGPRCGRRSWRRIRVRRSSPRTGAASSTGCPPCCATTARSTSRRCPNRRRCAPCSAGWRPRRGRGRCWPGCPRVWRPSAAAICCSCCTTAGARSPCRYPVRTRDLLTGAAVDGICGAGPLRRGRAARRNPVTAAGTDAGAPRRDGTWEPRPAARWEDAFLSGNGRHGAMVYGDPADDRVIVNHHTLVRPNGSEHARPPAARRPAGRTSRTVARRGHDGGRGVRRRTSAAVGAAVPPRVPDPGPPAAVARRRSLGDGAATAAPSTSPPARSARPHEDWRSRVFVSRADDVIVQYVTGLGLTADLTLDHALPGAPPRLAIGRSTVTDARRRPADPAGRLPGQRSRLHGRHRGPGGPADRDRVGRGRPCRRRADVCCC